MYVTWLINRSHEPLQKIHQVEDEQLGTTLRVAGGWVRDKVLGQWAPDGHVDIDIALDNMMGSEVRYVGACGMYGRSIPSDRLTD